MREWSHEQDEPVSPRGWGARSATGFKLDRSSKINSNAFDTKDNPGGAWNLPPNLRSVAESDKLKYRDIGESGRMTLRFVKPSAVILPANA